MTTLLFLSALLTLSVYTVVLAARGLWRWIRARKRSAAQPPPLPPIWKRTAAIPLLLWPVLIAALVPNLVDAVQRGRTFSSMAEIRRIATAVEEYSVDHGAYPDASTVEELARVLEPGYLEQVPRRDHWGNAYRYSVRDVRPEGPARYVIVSAGADGRAEVADPWSYPEGATLDYACDLVYSDGTFVRYPEGRGN